MDNKPPNGGSGNSIKISFRFIVISFVLLIAGCLIINSPSNSPSSQKASPGNYLEITPKQLEAMLNSEGRGTASLKVFTELDGDIAKITIQDINSGNIYKTTLDRSSDFYRSITTDSTRRTGGGVVGSIFGLLLTFSPIILLVVFAVMLFARRQGGFGGGPTTGDVTKSRARFYVNRFSKVVFADVAGAEEAKEEVGELVHFLKFPQRFKAVGAKIPRGILMIGPPGTGKTLLAKAIAGEANVPFISISGSEFVEMFVGVGAARVRDLFDVAKRNSPCIIFIDEIDAVGRHRGAGLGGGHDEREQTLNQILVEMDGFDTNANVIVIAATNRPDILDPALLRPGRFDRKVTLDLPDAMGRKQILEVHTKGKSFDEDVSMDVVARESYGFSGADLANLLNEAAILAARESKTSVSQKHIMEAMDRITLGPEKKSRIVSAEDKKITAYHEAGHAVVAWAMPKFDPLHKISIMARGMSGGHTKVLPETDRTHQTKGYLESFIRMALGGRIAEEMFCEDISVGASDDLGKATEIARAMVMRFAMGDLGKRTFGKRQEMIFLGREISEHQDYSEDTARDIDREIGNIIHRAEEEAREIIEKHADKLNKLVEALLEKETLDANDLKAILF